MEYLKKVIFGKVYEVRWESTFDDVVPGSIELYDNAPRSAPPDVRIFICSRLPELAPRSINPKLHLSSRNEMRTLFGVVQASWRLDDGGTLEVSMATVPARGWRGRVKKFRSMEFPTAIEAFEQVLHELIIVPSVYFFSDVAPVHAAAVRSGSSAVLLAGTGGVGKSSALLALRDQQENSFIADDIAVVSEEGAVHGNMAWPKIYGYNCVGNRMAEEILKGRGALDRIHFNVRNMRNPAGVRRKIAPDRLYSTVTPGATPIRAVCYLVREDVPEIAISPLSLDLAVKMTIAVMGSEYVIFHRHLLWEEYNALATARRPMLTMVDVNARWGKVLKSAWARARIRKVSIPLVVDHARYQSEIHRLVTQELNDEDSD